MLDSGLSFSFSSSFSSVSFLFRGGFFFQKLIWSESESGNRIIIIEVDKVKKKSLDLERPTTQKFFPYITQMVAASASLCTCP